MTTSTLPPLFPTSATRLLLARGGDPLLVAHRLVSQAGLALAEMRHELPEDQPDLRLQVGGAEEQLRRASGFIHQMPSLASLGTQMRSSLADAWNERLILPSSWMAQRPIPLEVDEDSVFGFSSTFPWLSSELSSTVADLLQPRVSAQATPRDVGLLAAVAEVAFALTCAARTFTAAIREYEHPEYMIAPLTLAGQGIDLYPGPLAPPYTRFAKRSVLAFHGNQVQITAADSAVPIVLREPVAALVHVVAPMPRALLTRYDKAERYRQLRLQDELGVIHFCNRNGFSLAAVWVADWLAQPEYAVLQPALTSPRGTGPHALTQALHAARFDELAAAMAVPIKRGVLHPPRPRPVDALAAASAQPAVLLPSASAPPGVKNPYVHAGEPQVSGLLPGAVRPAPHQQIFRGSSASEKAAYARRSQRRKLWRFDTGPASRFNRVLRLGTPYALFLAAFAWGYFDPNPIWAVPVLAWACIGIIEPWLWWAFERVSDHQRLHATAVYRPGRTQASNGSFALHAALIADGDRIGVRGSGGLISWSQGPGQGGITGLHQLVDDGGMWAFALIDASGRWRFVLPSQLWVQGDDIGPLAGFAQSVGLELGTTQALRPQWYASQVESESFREIGDGMTAHELRADDLLGTDVFGSLPDDRADGPATRGMIIMSLWAFVAFLCSLGGRGWLIATMAAVVLATIVPVVLRGIWRSLMRRRVAPRTHERKAAKGSPSAEGSRTAGSNQVPSHRK